ncbi:carnitine O-octanoyltransferase isoform X2 [Amblyomma americanum]
MDRASAEEARKERDRLYVSDAEATFAHDELLPALPVPPLRQTVDKYLDSVRAVVSDEEYVLTEGLATDFDNGVGAELNQRLLQRAQKSRNWLEQWWEDVAYLSQRQPLLPNSHMGGTFALFEDAFQFQGGRSLWAARNITCYLQFWLLLRQERLKPQSFRKIPWTMHQFRRFFNTTRVPAEGKDVLVSKFLTEAEESYAGESPSHVVVLQSGRVFTFDVLNDRREPLTTAEIATQLDRINDACTRMGRGAGVGTLTHGDRDSWAQNRRVLLELHPDNERSLRLIEDSMFAIVIDDASPTNRKEVMTECLKGDCTNRWVDKSYSFIVFENLTLGSSADHTPFDGMVPVTCAHFVHLTYLATRHNQDDGDVAESLPMPEELHFHLTDHLMSEMERVKMEYHALCNNLDVLCDVFTGYGKGFMKPVRIHPEAYLQVAIQLAYYKLHKKPGATYVTASTRGFYHGRTETCRACTPELVEFVQAALDGKTSITKVLDLLKVAVTKFEELMVECCKNHGCDRHLMGLALTAVEEGVPIPELFMDPAFIKSGGNGNFILSTSCNGYTPLIGCVAPMCTDGYGVFYSIEENRIIFALSAFKESSETNAEALYQHIKQALFDLQGLLLSAKL